MRECRHEHDYYKYSLNDDGMKVVFRLNMTPSKLSELENDVGFIKRTDLPEIFKGITYEEIE